MTRMRRRICRLSELEEGRGRLFEVDGRSLAVFRVGGEVMAVDDECPHRGGSLAFGDLQGKTVYCPMHAWPFDLRTGHCLDVPGAEVRTHGVHLVGDEVEIEL
jgi:nitrite reductase/ring-hydroxylating ferredoxin subunit